MQHLLRNLQHFSKTSTKHVELFSKLTLGHLGYYVSDTDALQYMQDSTFPLAGKEFKLEDALQQRRRLNDTSNTFTSSPWKSSSADILGCSTLFQDPQVTLCWFVIPPGRVLPLHDHPGMTVQQRVMHGRLHICSLRRDSTVSGVATPDHTRATVFFEGMVDGVGSAVAPADMLGFSEEDGGVFHEIRNVDKEKPALFVDIISPPYYQAPTNIPCTYYAAEPRRLGSERLDGVPEDCGIRWKLRRGDEVTLHPRPDYAGPAMNAFVYVGGDS